MAKEVNTNLIAIAALGIGAYFLLNKTKFGEGIGNIGGAAGNVAGDVAQVTGNIADFLNPLGALGNYGQTYIQDRSELRSEIIEAKTPYIVDREATQAAARLEKAEDKALKQDIRRDEKNERIEDRQSFLTNAQSSILTAPNNLKNWASNALQNVFSFTSSQKSLRKDEPAPAPAVINPPKQTILQNLNQKVAVAAKSSGSTFSTGSGGVIRKPKIDIFTPAPSVYFSGGLGYSGFAPANALRL